jgi:hypothetical protein
MKTAIAVTAAGIALVCWIAVHFSDGETRQPSTIGVCVDRGIVTECQPAECGWLTDGKDSAVLTIKIDGKRTYIVRASKSNVALNRRCDVLIDADNNLFAR